jgi:hypothetical protein
MPKITIKACANCGKKSCDGAIWRYIKIVEYCFTSTPPSYIYQFTGEEKEIDLKTIPEENMNNCSLSFGSDRMKLLKNKKVGDEVRLEFRNWSRPSWVIVKKIEE